MRKIKYFVFVGTIILAISSPAFSAEYATFESLYKESSSIGWIASVVFAVIAAVAIFYSWGTAGPIITSVGTWIGNSMGLYGAAATNAGLALLGGGSLASGGFGVAGGTMLLAAAFSFSTDVIVDFSAGIERIK